MKKNQASNEINLLEFFLVIMNNKMKIFLIIILTIAIIFSFEIFRGNENKNIQTKFTTKLKAISMLQETQHYLDLNNIYVDSNKIELNRFSLFDLFMKIIDAEKKELIKNFDFINKKNYKDKQVYEVELDEILSSIKISLSENKKTEGTLVFISKNEDMANKWRDFLNTFEDTINKKTQKYLKEVTK
jgi:LPS O-antigen subunit length determinant protein (WzzB/FepE family)